MKQSGNVNQEIFVGAQCSSASCFCVQEAGSFHSQLCKWGFNCTVSIDLAETPFPPRELTTVCELSLSFQAGMLNEEVCCFQLAKTFKATSEVRTRMQTSLCIAIQLYIS